ncbi:hypothetical protein Hanom_Chr06g00538071 [Helianthus anomalus]
MALLTGMRMFMVERWPYFDTEYVQSSSLANSYHYKLQLYTTRTSPISFVYVWITISCVLRVQEFSIFENLWVIIIE